MKVTNRLLYAQVVKDLDKNSEKLLNLNSQISSGKRINTPGDDPLGMASLLTYRGELNGLGQYQKSINYATGWLSRTDSLLQDMQNLMDRASELAVQEASMTATADTRMGAAEEIKQLREEMLSHANSKYGNKYMFGGTMTQSKPFLDVDVTKWTDDVADIVQTGLGAPAATNAGDGTKYINRTNNHIYQYSATTSTWTDQGVAAAGRYINITSDLVNGYNKNDIYQFSAGAWTDLGATPDGTSAVVQNKGAELYVLTGGEWQDFYQGNDTTFSMQIGKGDSVQTNLPGSDVFINSSGNVFMTLMKLERALRSSSQTGIQGSLTEIQTAGLVVSNNLASVGSVINRLEHTSTVIARTNVDVKKSKSTVEDLDYAEGITSLQNQQTIYQAALKSVSMITSLSLVDYIQ